MDTSTCKTDEIENPARTPPVNDVDDDEHNIDTTVHNEMQMSTVNKKPNSNINTVSQSQQTPTNTNLMDDFVFTLVFIARYIILFTTLSLLMIAILYTIGSIITLNADNLFCPAYSEEEVRAHNYENGLADGDPDSCYYIDRQRLNFNDIKNLNLNIFEASFVKISNVTMDVMIRFIFYLIICICLFGIIIYHSYFLIYDTLFLLIQRQTLCSCCNCNCYRNNNNKKNNKKNMSDKINLKTASNRKITFISKYLNPRVTKTFLLCVDEARSNKKRSNIEYGDAGDASGDQTNGNTEEEEEVIGKQSKLAFIETFVDDAQFFMKQYFRPYYYIDSKWFLLVLFVREIIEIMVQTYGLLLLGGLNIFDSTQNILSQESYVVRGMCVINCI